METNYTKETKYQKDTNDEINPIDVGINPTSVRKTNKKCRVCGEILYLNLKFDFICLECFNFVEGMKYEEDKIK